ncbi:MAG: M16 family metallopeptidase [Planctomycetota bacterium]
MHPAIQFGSLPSGLRWAWMDHAEPRERSQIRLHVDVGSLAESAPELGMAHVLEHMAFNGSRNFAPGTLVEWFQKHGMAFGADTNASTDFSATVYRLDLPRSDEDTLREGLTMLRDVADGLLLLPDEVAAELGVIDGEERERDSAGFRAWRAELADRFAGTRIPQRIPIGEAPVRARFDAPALRAFYERWYHPRAMTLILVGDLGGRNPEPLILELFGDMPARAAAPLPEPALGQPLLATRTFTHHSPEIPLVTLSVSRLTEFVEEPLTAATALRDVPLLFARRMLDLRLREISKESEAPFLEASADDAEAFRVLDGEELAIVCEPDRWRDALGRGEQELRRALEHGFQMPELEEVRRDWLRGLDEAVQRQATRPSAALADEIQAAAEGPFIPTTPETDRALYRPALEALTPEDCRQAFASAWSEGALRISAVGALSLGTGPQAPELLEVWEASRAVPVTPPRTLADQPFAYSSEAGVGGEIRERSRIADLEVDVITFANGVRAAIKRTDFQERQILVSARFGHGQVGVRPDQAATAWMAGRAFDGLGLAAHSVDDLRRLHAGRQVGVRFGVLPDAFALSGATSSEDLLLQLELVCAVLQHPGWREEGLRQVRDQIDPLFQSLTTQVLGPIQTGFLPRLHGGDARFGLPGREALLGVSLGNLQELLLPALGSGTLEVLLVGDLDVEAAVAQLARTVGALPARKPLPPPAFEQVNLARALREDHSVETEVPGSLVVAAFPTTDGRQALLRRRLTLLGMVLSDRLRVHIRETLGASYSPGAASEASRAFRGLGLLQLQAAAEPGREDEVLSECLKVTDTLAAQGITDEELERQREPLLARLRDQLRTNGFWLGLLSDGLRDAVVFDEARALESDYRSITAAELSELAQRYLVRDAANWITVRSAPPGSLPDGDVPAEGALMPPAGG